MRIGIIHGAAQEDCSLAGQLAAAKRAEASGFDSFWLTNILGHDAITSAALLGNATERIELGTSVVPIQPRHPMAMAQQALTASAATAGRLSLGIGLSHAMMVEGMFGLSYAKPAATMREYLQVLTPLLRGERVEFDGEHYRVHSFLDVSDAQPIPVIVAALGSAMLRLTAQLADGTITWMTGVKTLESHTLPRLRAAAEEVGRGAPRVVMGVPVVLTGDRDAARAAMDRIYAIYRTLPSYRAMLDREGVSDPADVALIGDEASLREQLSRLRDLGVSDLAASLFQVEEGSIERSHEFLAGER